MYTPVQQTSSLSFKYTASTLRYVLCLRICFSVMFYVYGFDSPLYSMFTDLFLRYVQHLRIWFSVVLHLRIWLSVIFYVYGSVSPLRSTFTDLILRYILRLRICFSVMFYIYGFDCPLCSTFTDFILRYVLRLWITFYVCGFQTSYGRFRFRPIICSCGFLSHRTQCLVIVNAYRRANIRSKQLRQPETLKERLILDMPPVRETLCALQTNSLLLYAGPLAGGEDQKQKRNGCVLSYVKFWFLVPRQRYSI
jgi:hypothetical protein